MTPFAACATGVASSLMFESARTYRNPSRSDRSPSALSRFAVGVGPGPGAEPSRRGNPGDRAVPELGEVLAVRILDRLAEIGDLLPAGLTVDPVERLRQVRGEVVRDPVEPRRHRDLRREHPREYEDEGERRDPPAAPAGEEDDRHRDGGEQRKPQVVRRPAVLGGEVCREGRAGRLVVGPAELDRLEREEHDDERRRRPRRASG